MVVDFSDGGNRVVGFGAHKDNSLSGAFELRNIFERKFDSLSLFGGEDNVIGFMGDHDGISDLTGFAGEAGYFDALTAAFL